MLIGPGDNAKVEKVKWGHTTWVCKSSHSQFVILSLCLSKMISAVLDAWLGRPYTVV